MCFCSTGKKWLHKYICIFSHIQEVCSCLYRLHAHRTPWNNALRSLRENRETWIHTSLFYYISFVLYSILPCAKLHSPFLNSFILKWAKKNTAAKNIFITPPALCALTSRAQPTTPPPHLHRVQACLLFYLPTLSPSCSSSLEVTQQAVCPSKEVLIWSPKNQPAINLAWGFLLDSRWIRRIAWIHQNGIFPH